MLEYCILVIILIFIFVEIKHELNKEKKETDISNLIKNHKVEKFETPIVETTESKVDAKDEKSINTKKIIIDNLKKLYSPKFANIDKLDADTQLSEIYGKNKSAMSKRAIIGNIANNTFELFKSIHTPLLSYYENNNWFDRLADYDFDK